MTLPEAFLRRPIAHRALHGPEAPENSLTAVRAAVAAGYGIEIDVQPSSDGVAMVFHDYDLDRLTETTGPLRIHSATALESVRLKASADGIPSLWRVLDLVAGRPGVLRSGSVQVVQAGARPEITLEGLVQRFHALDGAQLAEDGGPASDGDDEQQQHHDLHHEAGVQHELEDGKVLVHADRRWTMSSGMRAGLMRSASTQPMRMLPSQQSA